MAEDRNVRKRMTVEEVEDLYREILNGPARTYYDPASRITAAIILSDAIRDAGERIAGAVDTFSGLVESLAEQESAKENGG